MAGKSKFILSIFIIFMIFSLSGCSVYNRFLERSSVNFVTYTDENIERIRVGYAETIDVFEITRTGYTFDGWYIDESFTDEFDESTPITEDVTLYAKWIPNTYLITFVIDTNEQTIPMTYDTPLDLSTVTKTGFELAGLYTDPNLNSPFNSQTVPAQDTILYTSWERSSYAVEYKLPDGTVLDQQTLLFEDAIPLDPIERLGYAFQGWYADTDLQVPFNKVTMPATHLELYGAYTPLPFDISFETGEGSTISLLTVNYGDPITLEDPYYPGYIFVGWYMDSDLSVPFVYETMPAEDLTLYARYRPTTYTLTVYPENGETPYEISYGFETIIQELETPDRTGFTFAGWYGDSTLTTPFDDVVMPDSNINAYASWTRNSYTLSLISNPHPPLDTQSIPYEGAIELQTLSLTGYTFEGWFIDEQFEIPFSQKTMPAYDLILYSKFTINDYTITIEANNGDIKTTLTVPYNSAIPDLEDPQKTGFTFEGWFTDDVLTIPFTHQLMPSSDIIVYAKWSRNTYQLIFETTLHPSIETEFVLFDDVVNPPTLTLLGYTFVGWYEDADYQNPFSGQTMPASNLTLYAMFTINTYMLTVTENNGTLPYQFEFDYQEIIEGLMDPTKTGHAFVGWFLDEEETIVFELIAMPAEDLQIYASWSINTYRLSFDTSVSEPIEDQMVLYGTSLSLPALSVHGYQFIGWYENIDHTISFSHDTMPASNVIAYASFVPNQHMLTIYVPETFSKSTAGLEFTLLLTHDGKLFTSGKNNTGQLGDGTYENRFQAVETTHLFELNIDEMLTHVSAGWAHGYALSSEGRLFSWGNNLYGQLGNGSTVSSHTPSDITTMFDLMTEEIIIDVTSGYYHGMAMTSFGRVFTWGINYKHELGDGSTTPSILPIDITENITLEGDEIIIEIVASAHHNFVLSSFGHVYAWGNNDHGQIGIYPSGLQPLPIRVDSSFGLNGGELVVEIATGDGHTLVLTSSNRVIAFGHNTEGQLGIGVASQDMVPRDILPMLSLLENELITSVHAGGNSSAYLTSLGRLFVFGDNTEGQLGVPSNVDILTPYNLSLDLELSITEGILSMSFGASHGLILTTVGRLFTFGDNTSGQLSSSEPSALKTPIIHRLHALYDVAYASELASFFPLWEGFNYEEAYLDPNLSSPNDDPLMPDNDLILYVSYAVGD